MREDQIVERYLQGRLTADEEQALEERYLADPGLLEDLELTEHLREGLRRHGAGVQHDARRNTRWWLVALGTPQYAAAASILLVLSLVTSGVLFVQNSEFRGSAPAAAMAGGGARVLPLVNVRGEGGVNVVAAPAIGETTVFMIDPGFTEYDSYRATLTRAGAGEQTPLLRADGLSRTYEDFVAVSVSDSLLAPGDYEIVLEGRMSGWPEERPLDAITRTPLSVAPSE